MPDTLTPRAKQEWRWCTKCRRLFRTQAKFCPIDDWYLSDARPAHVPTRVIHGEPHDA